MPSWGFITDRTLYWISSSLTKFQSRISIRQLAMQWVGSESRGCAWHLRMFGCDHCKNPSEIKLRRRIRKSLCKQENFNMTFARETDPMIFSIVQIHRERVSDFLRRISTVFTMHRLISDSCIKVHHKWFPSNIGKSAKRWNVIHQSHEYNKRTRCVLRHYAWSSNEKCNLDWWQDISHT